MNKITEALKLENLVETVGLRGYFNDGQQPFAVSTTELHSLIKVIERIVREQYEAPLKLAEEALESCDAGDYSTGQVIHPSFNDKAVEKALAAIREALAEPVKQELNWVANKFMPHEQPVKQEPVAIESAEKMGATGAAPTESERQLFEAWMRGHCWAISGVWDGKTYVDSAETGGYINPLTMHVRCLWAAWRDRAALGAPVDAKAIRAEALEEAAKWLKESGLIGSNDCAAAIRGLK